MSSDQAVIQCVQGRSKNDYIDVFKDVIFSIVNIISK